jgi:hypothetical protein
MPFKEKLLEQLPNAAIAYKAVPMDTSKVLLPALFAEEAKRAAADKVLKAEETAMIKATALSVNLQIAGAAAAITAAGFSGISAYTTFYGSGAALVKSDIKFEELSKDFEKLKVVHKNLQYENGQRIQQQRLEKSFNEHRQYTDKSIIDGLRAQLARKWW